jgi:hypothetical protein
MSVVTDILDRLSGIAVVREKLDATMQRVEQLAERFWDHETRLRMLEGQRGRKRLAARTRGK